MTYSIRIGFLLAILGVIVGAGLYSRPQISAPIHHQQMGPVYSVTIPGKVPYWVGNLETTDLFSKVTHQASDWKKSITWWPHQQDYLKQTLVKKSSQITFTHNKTFTDVNTEILNLLWPHAHVVSVPASKYTHDELFLIQIQKISFSRLTYSYSYRNTQKQMQRGLFPHHYLHIIRPIIIVRTPEIKHQKTFIEKLPPYFSAINAFRQNLTTAITIVWEFPLSFKYHAQAEAGKIVFTPHRYTFAKPLISSQSPFVLSPITVQSAALMGDTGHTQLILHLSQKPFYIIRTDTAHQTITLAIDNINPDISSIPALDTTGSAIHTVAFDVTPENQLLVTLTLLPQTEIQGLRYQENNLIVDMGVGKTIPYTQTSNTTIDSSTDSSAEVEAQPVIKTPVPLSDNELAAENYNEAVDLLNQGNAQGAIGLLQMLVAQHPNYLDGRLLLANLLLQQNQVNQALAVLQKVATRPSIYQSQDYFNLLAEAYRQSGNFKSAITIYQKLLMTNQSQGAWWVGLGMCFEGLKQTDAATESYQKALATGNLSPLLQTFVTKKLSPTE